MTLVATTLVSETFEPMQIYLVLAVLYLALIVPIALVAHRLETRLGVGQGVVEDLQHAIDPQLTAMPEAGVRMAGDVVADLLRGGLISLEIAAGAWLLAVVLGLVLAVLRDLGMAGVRAFQVSLVVTLRSVPQLVVLYLIYFGLGQIGIEVNSVLAAIVALGITDAAFVAEYYRAGFMTVPSTQREAGLSLGLSRLGVLWWVVIPQVVPFVVPPLLNAFVGLLKTATLAAAVGAPEVSVSRAERDEPQRAYNFGRRRGYPALCRGDDAADASGRHPRAPGSEPGRHVADVARQRRAGESPEIG